MTVKLNDFTEYALEVVGLPKNLKMSLLLDFYAPMLTENQREAVRLYYNEDLSLAEIAQDSGITRQGVRDTIKRGEAVMQELEDKLHFVRWYEQHERVAKSVRADADEIILCSSRAGMSSRIKEKAQQIVARLDELEVSQE